MDDDVKSASVRFFYGKKTGESVRDRSKIRVILSTKRNLEVILKSGGGTRASGESYVQMT
jgi:hypothetical protein